jgi:hypothetical protein
MKWRWQGLIKIDLKLSKSCLKKMAFFVYNSI